MRPTQAPRRAFQQQSKRLASEGKPAPEYENDFIRERRLVKEHAGKTGGAFDVRGSWRDGVLAACC